MYHVRRSRLVRQPESSHHYGRSQGRHREPFSSVESWGRVLRTGTPLEVPGLTALPYRLKAGGKVIVPAIPRVRSCDQVSEAGFDGRPARAFSAQASSTLSLCGLIGQCPSRLPDSSQ